MFHIVLYDDSRGVLEQFHNVFQFKRFFQFDVDGFAVGIEYRNSYGSSSYLDIIVAQDLVGFVDHLHFFFCVAVVGEHVDVRQTVACNRVSVSLQMFVVSGKTVLQVVDALDTGTGYCLVSRVNDSLDAVFILQRF